MITGIELSALNGLSHAIASWPQLSDNMLAEIEAIAQSRDALLLDPIELKKQTIVSSRLSPHRAHGLDVFAINIKPLISSIKHTPLPLNYYAVLYPHDNRSLDTA